MKQIKRIVIAACLLFWVMNMVWYYFEHPEWYQISNAILISVTLGAVVWFIRDSFWLTFFFILSISNVVKTSLPTREVFMVNDYFMPVVALLIAWYKIKKKK